MASATLYTARLVGPEVLEAGVTSTITCPVYRDGALVVPTSGTITVWNRDGVVVVSAAAVTITASVATYDVTSGALAGQVNSDGWRVEWALTISSLVVTFRREAALVYRRLYPVVTDADLLRAHTDLARRLPSTESSYQDYLDESWARLESRLIGTGRRPWLVMAPSALRDAHLYLTLALVFQDFATGGPGTAEWETAMAYHQRYEASWAALVFPQATPDGDPSRRRRVAAGGGWWLAGRP